MVGEVCDRELGVSSGKIAEDESRKLEIATSLTLLVGIIQVYMKSRFPSSKNFSHQFLHLLIKR